MYVQFVYTYSKCLRLYAQRLYACAFCEYWYMFSFAQNIDVVLILNYHYDVRDK